MTTTRPPATVVERFDQWRDQHRWADWTITVAGAALFIAGCWCLALIGGTR